MFHKLLMNFTWWVNRKDAEGNNVFQGGFLGLDNIGLFDRSLPLPTGKVREMTLRQIRLEITIAKRGGNAVLWKGTAVTVRPAEAREGSDDVVAANLAEVLLRNYPIQAAEAISIP